MSLQSTYLSLRELEALERLGDLLVPGSDGLPAFSTTGCIAHVDELLAVTPTADVRDLKRLLWVLSLLPDICLLWLLRLLELRERLPGPVAAPLRLLNIGLKGIVFSLYYSGLTGPYAQGRTVLDHLGYELHCAPAGQRSLP